MAGKSTYIRQVALITLLAHTGSYVPAKSATIGVVDRIFTRVGASDELHSGQSTFMVEMVETANILNNATPHSLVILDEIGRGTSTLDGLSLAWAIAETLSNRKCRTLFATHYHELTTLADRDSSIVNLHVTVREWKDEIVFLYGIKEGRTDRSYGIHVAKLAGVPQEVVQRANELLETLTVHTQQASEESTKKIATPQMNLFTEYVQHPAVDTLKSVDIDAMSPLEAFELIRTLKNQVE
jgi:DNA mismatch repair protein MutS